MDKISMKDFIAEISTTTGMQSITVKNVLESVARILVRDVSNGQAVSFTGLGKFYPAERAARTCRNPATGGTVEVPAKRVMAFKASKGGEL